MNFFKRLQNETKSERDALYAVPLIQRALAGDISREIYLAYLAEAYHHVKHTLRLLMLAGGNLPEEKEWARRAFAEYVSEETGHEEWILNDIEQAGGNREAVISSLPSRPIELMVSYCYDAVMRRNPLALLGMVFVLEGTSTALATNAASVIQATLKLPDSCFTYLRSHGALDVGHMQFFESVVNRITDPKDQQDIIHSARVIFGLFAQMFEGLSHSTPTPLSSSLPL